MSNSAFNPDDIYNPIAISGTTQTPTSLITETVQTKNIEFADGSRLTGLSQNFQDNQYNASPSSYALFMGLSALDSNIKALDPDNNFFRDNTVVTLPLINSLFKTPWEVRDWDIINDEAFYTGRSIAGTNYLKIPSEVLTFPGYYYLNIKVTRLDSGVIRIYDHTDTQVAEIIKVGEANIEMYIANTDITSFRIVAEDVFAGDYITISSAMLHRITDRFRDYFLSTINRLGLQGADEDYIKAVVNSMVASATTALTIVMDSIKQQLLSHLSDINNPHDIKPEKIDAARKQHTHDEFALINGDLTMVIEHINDTSTNPHGVNYKQAGAAKEEHTHIPSDCGASPVDHTHPNLATVASVTALSTNLPALIKDELAAQVATNSFGAVPYIVTKPKEFGIEPLGAEDSIITKPATVVVFPYNLHQSTSDYDYNCGLAVCNRTLLNAESAAKAFSDYYCTCASFKESSSSIKETILQYTFHTARKFSGLLLFKDVSNAITGFATELSIYIDDVLVKTVSNTNWSDFSKYSEDQAHGRLSIDFDNTIIGKRIKLVITKAKMDSSLSWAIRVRMKYADVAGTDAGNYGIIAPFSMNFGMSANTKITNYTDETANITGRIDLPSVGSPTYLYFRKSETESGMFTPEGDVIPSEFSLEQHGQNVLLDQYPNTNLHPTWGMITSTNTDADHPAYNLYNNNAEYFKSVDGATQTVITHEFAQPQSGVTGLRFVFSDAIMLNNLVPDKITISYVTQPKWQSGDTTEVILTDVVIADVVPEIRANGSGYMTIKVKHADGDIPKQVSKIVITLTATKGQPAIAMSNLIVMLRGWWFNPWSGEATNANRCPFGRFERVALPSSCTLPDAIIHTGISTVKCLYYPIEHFNQIDPGEYVITNPFCTTELTTDLLSLHETSGNYTNPINRVGAVPTIVSTLDPDNPTGEVTAIDVNTIKITVYHTGRYAVKVYRLW